MAIKSDPTVICRRAVVVSRDQMTQRESSILFTARLTSAAIEKAPMTVFLAQRQLATTQLSKNCIGVFNFSALVSAAYSQLREISV